MRLTKTLVAAAAATMIATAGFAGGFAPAVVQPDIVVIEPTQSASSWGIVLPIAALVLLAGLAAASGDSDSGTATNDDN